MAARRDGRPARISIDIMNCGTPVSTAAAPPPATVSGDAALLSYGVHSKRQRVRVMARMPNQEEAEVFGLPHPILVVESTYVDQAGAPVDFGASRYASGRVQLDIELDENLVPTFLGT
ncbi:UTRA domain-containing protein [Bradyrhizobium diazoefficiens]|uniref:GntR family transcriptional regulator n=1 Tax=Bradyrhizobium diazoefficiens TaxID=1355477 RepID=A0A0E4BXL2_9BRAD|nr:UTRA domain-containing protein [Bradyrhizobium diazoefficiens]BAR63589.1 GntR family transcriptional regulator [Bradyrhizobium diazoefficiens]